MFYPKYQKTVDGHELTWQSNHLGIFLLIFLVFKLSQLLTNKSHLQLAIVEFLRKK